MGLDAVELVMDVEDHFGISIQSSEVERIRRVRDLVSLVQSRIEAAHTAKCSTLTSFLCLRSCVRDIVSNHQLRIRSDTRIVEVLDPPQRRQLWKRLEKLLGAPPPSLRRSTFIRKALATLVIVSLLLAVVSAGIIGWAVLPLTLVFAALLSLALALLTMGFRVHPPDRLTTFGLIAKRISGTRVATDRLHLRTFDAILNDLRPILAKNCGVDEAEVVADARIVEDLGMS